MLQAIIFDVDGTLADTEEIHRAAFNQAFSESRLDWHWDEARYGGLLKVTGGKERIAHFMDSAMPGRYASQDCNALIAQLHARKTFFYERLAGQTALKLRPGVEALIKAAQTAGVRLAIATTTTPANVMALLQSTLGSDGPALFEVIAAGDCVARKKPAPDIYLSTLVQLSLPASACLAIEDSQNGLQAALAAGLRTVVTPSFYTMGEDFSGAARVLPSLAEAAGADVAVHEDAILRSLRDIHAQGSELSWVNSIQRNEIREI